MKAGTPLFGGRHKSRKGETKNPVITPFPVLKEMGTVKRIRYPQSSSGFRPALLGKAEEQFCKGWNTDSKKRFEKNGKRILFLYAYRR